MGGATGQVQLKFLSADVKHFLIQLTKQTKRTGATQPFAHAAANPLRAPPRANPQTPQEEMRVSILMICGRDHRRDGGNPERPSHRADLPRAA